MTKILTDLIKEPKERVEGHDFGCPGRAQELVAEAKTALEAGRVRKGNGGSDEKETGDEVLSRIRKTINTKEGWIKVERVRKDKDRQIIMGFGSTEDRNEAKEGMGKEGTGVKVEDVKYRDPLDPRTSPQRCPVGQYRCGYYKSPEEPEPGFV
ncbi:unnamed protein product [Euphydryas editha]|uniref:Uncharacterized protein n=1 Tax=Euphydryas editha TaxID=104508 RepID=A0AAU9TIR1_EUPED|nr:unnamed protein product [Euphydryas editha]